MAASLVPLLNHLRRLSAAESDSDAARLDRFARLGDQRAFAALVDEHGPMVLRVCRRVLGDLQAAEDATQATFLVLARKAGAVGRAEALSCWLHGVARRVALKARAGLARRGEPLRAAETPADKHPDPLTELSVRELLAIIDEEVERLPRENRLPVLLCCLEGKSQEEVAHQLGWTPGSVKGRLERGRKQLHARLVRRGVVPAAAFAAVEIWRAAATAAMPAALALATVRAAVAFTGGQCAAGTASTEAARLAGEVIGGMGTGAAKLALVLLLVVGLTAIGATALTRSAPTEATTQPETIAQQPAPKTEAKGHVDREGVPLPLEAITRLGSARMRADAAIVWVGYTRDDKTIVCATRDRTSNMGSIQFWDAATGKLRTGKSVKMVANAAGLAIRPDGKILHLDGDGFYRVLSAADGSEISRVRLALAGTPSSVWLSVCFSPNGTMLAVRSASDQVRMFDLVDGKEQPPLKLQAAPAGNGVFVGQTLAFTPDGATLVVASEDDRIETFDVAKSFKKSLEFKVPLKRVHHLSISPDGRDLFCGGVGPGSLILRDWKGRKELVRVDKANAPTTGSPFSPDGRRLAVANYRDGATLFEVVTGKRLHHFPTGQAAPVVSFAHDGRTLLTGSASCAMGQWDTTTGSLMPASADPQGYLSPLQFTPDAKHLIAYTDRHVLFDCFSGRLLRPCAPAESDYLLQAKLSNDGAIMAVPRSKELLLIDAHTGKELRRIDASGAYLNSPSFHGSRLFATCSDGVIRVWDANGTGLSRSLKDPDPVSGTLWISTHGEFLALAPIGGQAQPNQEIRLWDVTAGKIIRRMAPPRQAMFFALSCAADTHLLAIAPMDSSGTKKPFLDVVDLRTGKATPFAAMVPNAGPLAFSPDARTLVTGDFDGERLRLWEVATGKERWQFRGHKTMISSLVWSADGALLASSSPEAPAYIWDVYGNRSHERPAPPPWTAAQKSKVWEDLLGSEAKAGFEAIRALIQSPDSAIALLRGRVKPVEPVNAAKLKQLLRDLDGDDFEARQGALAELQKLGDRIEGALQHALKTIPSLEAKRRLQALLENVDVPLPERLAQGRALESLEQIASPEAVRLIEALAAGAPEARLTREAAEVLHRVRK